MFLIFDNLSATLIGMAVLLLLVIMQQRVQRVSAEQVMMYAANQNILDFGKWVEEDMVNVGWGVTTGNGISGIAQNDTIPSLTRLFTFDRKPNTADPPTTVQYQVIPVTLTSGIQVFTEINGTDVPLWQVQRLEGGVVTGESAPYVTHFSILLENDLGQGVFALADAEQISIEVAMAMPYGEDAYIPETHWGTTFGLLAAN